MVRRQVIRRARGAALAACVGALAVAFVRGPATEWLLAEAPPERADLLVILSGGARERVRTGLSLYRAGLAPAILITDPEGYPAAELAYFEREGVPPQALLAPLRPAASTYEDALSIRQVIGRKSVKSILVVTSPPHCRRAGLILNRVLRNSGVRVTVTPSESLYFDPHRWWTDRQGWANVAVEFPKLLWAWLTVPMAPPVGGFAPSE